MWVADCNNLSLLLLPPRTLHLLQWVPATGCSSSRTAPEWVLPMGYNPLGKDSLVWGSPWAAVWISAALWASKGCREATCLPWSSPLPAWLQGSLRSVTWITFSTRFFIDAGVHRARSFTFSHCSLPAAVVQSFLPFLKYVVTEILIMLLLDSALASRGPTWSQLELTAQHGGSF